MSGLEVAAGKYGPGIAIFVIESPFKMHPVSICGQYWTPIVVIREQVKTCFCRKFPRLRFFTEEQER